MRAAYKLTISLGFFFEMVGATLKLDRKVHQGRMENVNSNLKHNVIFHT